MGCIRSHIGAVSPMWLFLLRVKWLLRYFRSEFVKQIGARLIYRTKIQERDIAAIDVVGIKPLLGGAIIHANIIAQLVGKDMQLTKYLCFLMMLTGISNVDIWLVVLRVLCCFSIVS